MKQHAKCPKCGGERIWRLERIAAQDHSVTESGGAYELKLVAGGTKHAFGHFDAYVCEQCSYTEFWSVGLARLTHGQGGAQLVSAGGGSSADSSAQRLDAEQRAMLRERTEKELARTRQERAACEERQRSGRAPSFKLGFLAAVAIGAGLTAVVANAIVTAPFVALWVFGGACGGGLSVWLKRTSDRGRLRLRVEDLRVQVAALEHVPRPAPPGSRP